MFSWISIVSLVSVLGLLAAQNIIYDINTQAKCTEVQRSRTNDCRWPAGLDMADQIIEGGRIAAYKIQWFSGAWSGWFVPGVNDLSTKFNTHPRTCSLSYRAKSMRRRWAMFYDHTHKFIICKPQ